MLARLVRILSALLRRSATRLLCLSSSAVDSEFGSCSCSLPASVASCLNVAIRSWTDACLNARMRCTREWCVWFAPVDAIVGGDGVSEAPAGAASSTSGTGLKSIRLQKLA